MISVKDALPYDTTCEWRQGNNSSPHRYHPYTRSQDSGPSITTCIRSPRLLENAAATAPPVLPLLNHPRPGILSINELVEPRSYSPPPVPGDAQRGETTAPDGTQLFAAESFENPIAALPHFGWRPDTIHEGETLLLEGELGRHWEVEKKVDEHGDYSLMTIKHSRHRLITVLAVRHERVAAPRFSTNTGSKTAGSQDTVGIGGSFTKLPRSARNLGNKKVARPYWVENLNPTNYQGQRYFQ
ncbi:hypothetical protein C8R47DRAFT_1166420, partial [Mycena vitilis]